MRTQSRTLLVFVCTAALLGLALAGTVWAVPVQAAGARSVEVAAAQATPAATTPITGTTDAGTTDHAAHHPGAAQAVTETMPSAADMPSSSDMTPGAAGMGGMGGMMGSMGAMHGEMAGMMADMMEKYADEMSPEMAADMGRMQGMMEGTGAMMGDMGAMMKCPMMGGMMSGDMMSGDMMSGMKDSEMPMGAGMGVTGTVPATGTMPGMQGMDHTMPMSSTTPGAESMDHGAQGMGGMMGMMHSMHGDMATMMEQMPADMAQRMHALHDRMGAVMSTMEGMDAAMPMTGTAPGMEGMDHSSMTNPEQPFDAQFIDSMIEHHQGAIDMATLVLTEAEHEDLRTMAEAVIETQSAEIEQMRTWRAEWYPDLPATQGMDMAMGDMAISEDASIAFDFRFLQAMISHHEGAVMMAEMALTEAEHAELRTMAQAIIDAQEAEIDQMRAWAAEWHPELELPAGPEMNMGPGSAMAHPDMAAVHAEMDAMQEEMQGMMDEMMAGETMTPGMAAGMGRMMGRLHGMSSMMEGMGGMMECPMMSDMMGGMHTDDK